MVYLGSAEKVFRWWSQLPNFPPNHPNRWHFLISKKPKDIIQQGF